MKHASLLTSLAARQAWHQRGLTLVEFMVSIAIGLILLTGLLALMARQSETQRELEKTSRQIENGRYAMQLLQEDVQLAGYFGEYFEGFPEPATLPDPCKASASDDLTGAAQLAVQGYDAPTNFATLFASCPADWKDTANHKAGTDVLVVRRVDPVPAKDGELKVGDWYLQVGLNPATASPVLTYKLTTAGTTSINTTDFPLKTKAGAVAPLRKWTVHVYYISPCSVPKSGNVCGSDADGGSPIPTLKRLELNAGSFVTVPLVEGIENMQIDYGKDIADGDGSPDSYLMAKSASFTADPKEWVNVMSVRVHLLARNNDLTADHQDRKLYDLGLAGKFGTAEALASASYTCPSTPAPAEICTLDEQRFKRKAFTQAIRVVNPSARRETSS